VNAPSRDLQTIQAFAPREIGDINCRRLRS
jgi:hypothetical protein